MSAVAAEASVRASPTPGAGSRRVLYVAIAVDIAMAVAKFFVAALTGSSAMLTEGVHSLVDIGIAIAALGAWLGHALNNPYLDPVAAVLIASAALLARKSVSLLVGVSLDRDQLAQLRKIITVDPAVEPVGRLLTMRMGPDSVLLTAAVRFQRRLTLDEVEQAIERLERAIKAIYPSILHLYLAACPARTSRSSTRARRWAAPSTVPAMPSAAIRSPASSARC